MSKIAVIAAAMKIDNANKIIEPLTQIGNLRLEFVFALHRFKTFQVSSLNLAADSSAKDSETNFLFGATDLK